MVSMFDIIFLTVLVAFIISRLYSVFGSHGREENLRIVIKPIDENTEKNLEKMAEAQIITTEDMVQNSETSSLSETDKLLATIPAFNKAGFIKGACRVFEMVLQAFSSGELDKIKSLLSKKVYDAFFAAYNYRRENNLTSEVDFICFDKSEIKDVKLLKNSVRIVVEFVSEQVNILRNGDGVVVEGDENFVQKITDTWTFERSLNAKNKNWTLVSTKKSA